jgi:hypothetical protein
MTIKKNPQAINVVTMPTLLRKSVSAWGFTKPVLTIADIPKNSNTARKLRPTTSTTNQKPKYYRSTKSIRPIYPVITSLQKNHPNRHFRLYPAIPQRYALDPETAPAADDLRLTSRGEIFCKNSALDRRDRPLEWD